MDWTHLAVMGAGCFVGSFLMTVWRNEQQRRSRQRAAEQYRMLFMRGRWYPPATQPPPPAPPAPPEATT